MRLPLPAAKMTDAVLGALFNFIFSFWFIDRPKSMFFYLMNYGKYQPDINNDQ